MGGRGGDDDEENEGSAKDQHKVQSATENVRW